MPMTKPSRVNQRNREVATAEIIGAAAGCRGVRGRRTPLASPDQGDARSPSRALPDGLSWVSLGGDLGDPEPVARPGILGRYRNHACLMILCYVYFSTSSSPSRNG